jgi:ABC-2 type transport system permease protein
MSGATTFAAFVRRDWAVARSYRMNFVMSLISSGFFLIVLYYFGKLVDRGGFEKGDLRQGYFPFVVVGIALLQIVQAALRSSAVRIRDEQTTGTLEAVVATPASLASIALGGSVYDVLQATALSGALVACAFLLGLHLHVGLASAGASLVALVALVVLFTSLSVVVAAFIVVFKQGGILTRLVGNGLAFLGGVYFPIALLPGPVRAVAQAVPFTWGVDALRASLLRGEVEPARVAGLVASAAVGLPIALWLFRVAVDRSRLRGTMAQF